MKGVGIFEMKKQLFVGNLSFKTTPEDLKEAFSPYGQILDIRIPIDKLSGRQRGFAFIEFETPEMAQKALSALHQTTFLSRVIRVSFSEERPHKRL
jgi:RNA recognition motif-containing protein